MLENQSWLFLSLLTAIAVSSQEAFAKRFFSGLNTYEMSAYQFLYSLPMFLAVLPWIPVPALDRTFLWSFLLSLPLNGAAFLLHMAAIKVSPLSLTLPYLAFTPVFMIGTGFVFLGEFPNIYGAGGILSICAGSYILHIEPGKLSFLGPFRAFFRETGSRLMFLVAFMYSFGAVIGKIAILHSSPVFFSISFFAAFDTVLLIFLISIGKIMPANLLRKPWEGALTGFFLFCHALFHGLAISMTQAAYMISVKRLSVLFGVIYGGFLFREENIGWRFCGALFMVAGAALILLKG